MAGMEYNSVTFVAYFSAAVVSALLTATYLFQLVRKQKTWLFAGAAAVHTLHLGAIALSFSEQSIPLYLLIIFEYLHFNAWVFCIGLSLKHNTQRKQLPASLQLLFSGGWPITALAIAMLFIPNMNQAGLSVWFALGLAVIALVSVEQLYRYAAENDRQIKLLCMNLAAIFLYDIYLFTHAVFSFRWNLPPLRVAVSSNPTLRNTNKGTSKTKARYGIVTLSDTSFQRISSIVCPMMMLPKTTIRMIQGPPDRRYSFRIHDRLSSCASAIL
jgi:hypothetical protein